MTTRRAILGLICVSVGAGCVDQRVLTRPTWDGWPASERPSRVAVRVATYNIEDGVDDPGSVRYKALIEVVERLNPDVLLLNEVELDDIGAGGDLETLASDLAMTNVFTSFPQPFGELGNAVLSRLPFNATHAPTAADLSGDPSAEDLTRTALAVEIAVPNAALTLGLVSTHLKSAASDTDYPSFFRRAVDAVRTAQAADQLDTAGVAAILGDMNYDPTQLATPSSYGDVPTDLVDSYSLGADIRALTEDDALSGSVFASYASYGWNRVSLTQRDGTVATRPESGRNLDHVLVDGRANGVPVHGEIFDCLQDGPTTPGLADGPRLSDVNDCNRVSDHLPVLVEFLLPGAL